jgi:hypothetical protein
MVACSIESSRCLTALSNRFCTASTSWACNGSDVNQPITNINGTAINTGTNHRAQKQTLMLSFLNKKNAAIQ